MCRAKCNYDVGVRPWGVYPMKLKLGRISAVVSRSSEHNKGHKSRETFAVRDQNDFKKASTRVEHTSVDVKRAEIQN